MLMMNSLKNSLHNLKKKKSPKTYMELQKTQNRQGDPKKEASLYSTLKHTTKL